MPDTPTFFYYAGPSKKALELVDDTVAVALLEAVPERRLERLRESERSVDAVGLSPELLSRNVLVHQTGPAASGPERVLTFAERLSRAPSVRYVTNVFRDPETGLHLIPTDEVNVRFRTGIARAQVEELLAGLGAEILEQKSYQPDQYLVRVSEPSTQRVLDFANALHESALTEWAEPNFAMEVQFRQDLRNRQWHLHNTSQNGGTLGEDIKANEAWQVTRGSGNVVIAIIDDGVETSHPGLAPNLLLPGGSNLTTGDPNNPNPSGNDSHGTRCAGVAAGAAAGLIDGAAPSCKILPVKLLSGTTTPNQAADAIHYGALHAQILSNSWGLPFSQTIEDAMRDVIATGREGKGTIVLFAIGNDNNTIPLGDQSTVQGVIAVGASTNVGSRAGYSNFGDDAEIPNPNINLRKKQIIVAPSAGINSLQARGFGVAGTPDNSTENIYTVDRQGTAGANPPAPPRTDPANTPTNRFDYTGNFSGTSSSCPLVAGICGLMLSINADLTAKQVKYILEATADKIATMQNRPDVPTGNVPAAERAHYDPSTGCDSVTVTVSGAARPGLSRYGFGRTNAEKAVKAARGDALPQLVRPASGAPTIQPAIPVTLRRVPGTNHFVSEAVIELVDARRDSTLLNQPNRIFVRGGPGGFLRATLQPAGGGPAMTDEVTIQGQPA